MITYPRQVSRTWFLTRWPYRIFMLRELSGIFLAGYTILLLVLVMKVHDGPAAYSSFRDTLQSPALIVFNCVALLFALLHTVTWFQAMPKVLPLRYGHQHRLAFALVGVNYLLFLAVTAIILVLVLV
jgi:succinate dehydrogenase subunit C